jgi:GNAT superfamily N-acetyltransferase
MAAYTSFPSKMSSLTIKEVLTSRQRLSFIKMPWRIYRGDPHWVPPLIAEQREFLNPRKGVFFDHGEARLFLAHRAGETVGRISAHINSVHDEMYGQEKGFFGFFECVNDQETANALFKKAADYAASRGRRMLEGPLSFGIYDEVGILVKGFDNDPYVMNVHNPPYYRELLENAGFEKSVDWYAYRGLLKDYVNLDKRLFRLMERTFERSGIEIRACRENKIPEEAEIVRRIFHSAWERNWGHVPFTEGEWKRMVKALKAIVVPELTLIAEKDGQPVGFTLTAYDANETVKKLNGRLFPFGFIGLLISLKKTKRIRFILMGIMEEFRSRGIENALMLMVARRAFELGFEEIEMSLIVETNQPMVGAMKHFPVDISKVYRIYQKEIS